MNAKRRFQVIITGALIASLPFLMGAQGGCGKATGGQAPDTVTLAVYGGEAGTSIARITYQKADGRYVQIEQQKLPWVIKIQRTPRTSVTAEVFGGEADRLECVAERESGNRDKDDTKFIIGNKVTCTI